MKYHELRFPLLSGFIPKNGCIPADFCLNKAHKNKIVHTQIGIIDIVHPDTIMAK